MCDIDIHDGITHSRYMWAYPYGHIAVDLVNTRTKRLKDVKFESLTDWRDLVDWMSEKGLIDEKTKARATRALARDQNEGAALLQIVLRLREALAAVLTAQAAGRRYDPKLLRVVEEIVAAGRGRLELNSTEGVLSFVETQNGKPRELLLRKIVGEVIDLFSGQQSSKVRRCAMHDCGSLFLDRSHAGVRMWCHASLCGNLDKVRRHRSAARPEPSGG